MERKKGEEREGERERERERDSEKEKGKEKEREREKRSWRLLPRRAVLGWFCGGFHGTTATRDELYQHDEELHVC